MTTNEKGMTFDDKGNPMMYKKPKPSKDMLEGLDFNLDTDL